MTSSATSATSGGDFDATVLSTLVDDLGDDTARIIVEAFLTELPGRLEELRDEDQDVRRRAAHTLKSGAALVGLGPMSRASAELEASGGTLEQVLVLAESGRDALRAWLEG